MLQGQALHPYTPGCRQTLMRTQASLVRLPCGTSYWTCKLKMAAYRPLPPFVKRIQSAWMIPGCRVWVRMLMNWWRRWHGYKVRHRHIAKFKKPRQVHINFKTYRPVTITLPLFPAKAFSNTPHKPPFEELFALRTLHYAPKHCQAKCLQALRTCSNSGIHRLNMCVCVLRLLGGQDLLVPNVNLLVHLCE
jgi:hypothetical protein